MPTKHHHGGVMPGFHLSGPWGGRTGFVRWQGVEPCSPMATPADAQRSPPRVQGYSVMANPAEPVTRRGVQGWEMR